MNDRKIALIIVRTNQEDYQNFIHSLEILKMPTGYELEVLAIDSKTAATARLYQMAAAQSDAKYKFYFKERVLVCNANVIQQSINVFAANPNIGMIGLSGAMKIGTDASVYESERRVGMLQNGKGRVFSWNAWEKNAGTWQEVEAVDDYFFVTQYDIPWREDLFAGEDFFVTAQCIEYRRRQYKNVVLRTSHPWVIWQETRYSESDFHRNVFLDEYSKDVFPFVGILIPTYNRPEYFKIALESALAQTYRNIEIVVSDDGSNDLTENLIQPYLKKYPHIKYKHHRNFTAEDNFFYLYHYYDDKPEVEYINFLFDDDVFDKRKIEKMVQPYLMDERISLVTSYRQTIDEQGNLFENNWVALKKWTDRTTRYSGEEVRKIMFSNMINIVGEPTTVLIKRSVIKDCLYERVDVNTPIIFDFAAWIHLSYQGDIMYIPEPLSYFRIHPDQGTYNPEAPIVSMSTWAMLFRIDREKGGGLHEEDAFLKVISLWMKNVFAYITRHYVDTKTAAVQTSQLIPELLAQYQYLSAKMVQIMSARVGNWDKKEKE